MRMKRRVDDLQRRQPQAAMAWVRVFQYEGQTKEEAIAGYEAKHGPIDNKGVILRVIIGKPSPALVAE